MKTTNRITTIPLDVVNPQTGQCITVVGEHREVNTYYSVSKITTRINMTEFFKMQTIICNSITQVELLGKLLDMMTADNRLLIGNQSKLADQLGTSKGTLSKLLKSIVVNKLAIKDELTGSYFINPYIIIGKRTRSNEARETLQQEWSEINLQDSKALS